jgi:hypothetical protein
MHNLFNFGMILDSGVIRDSGGVRDLPAENERFQAVK